jgi:glycosyltransferase involved in cell wall biosynthesis
MTVLHTVASLHPDAGGPTRTVGGTCAHLAEAGAKVEIVSRRQERDPVRVPEQSGLSAHFASHSGSLLRDAWRFWQTLSERLGTHRPTLIHDHGVWLPTNLISALEARRRGLPHVVTTRGMLEPWALEHQSVKKKHAWYAYQRWILQSASLLHATAEMEARQLRDLGLTAPIAVIPNGVPLPGDWKQSASDGKTRQALFLSRIHPKKGLLNLVDAWAEVAPANWRLVIAGPDENNHRQKVEQRVEACGLTDVVDFPGPIDDADKWDLYRESDLFVLPTFSENFGVVVAEALASGVPAITTTGAPWQVLEEERCGWWIEPEVDALADVLRDATTRSDAERLAMGRRGRALVRDRFAWPSIAERLLEAYRWILGEGPKPGFVWAG